MKEEIVNRAKECKTGWLLIGHPARQALCSAYAHPMDEKVREEYKADENRKQDQKINRTNAIAMTKEILIAMFVRKDYNIAIEAYDAVASKTREIFRPCRSNERKHRPKKLYSMDYKRL